MATAVHALDSITVPFRELMDHLRARLSSGARLVSLFGSPAAEPRELMLTTVVEQDGALICERAALARERGFHALTPDFPCAHIFEREIFESFGVRPHDHPWLKPVRYPVGSLAMRDYAFWKLEGKEVHEVAVGPIHAGVIEPGHFRFMCLGETVHHLEIQLGYQHRAAEGLLLRRNVRALTPLVETICGDSSVAHAWAYCAALEALCSTIPTVGAQVLRGMALELERVAMHLAGLAGLCTDVAFLQGAATYGRLRTTAINTSLLICGSRFGRTWLRPGGSRAGISAELRQPVQANLALLERDLAIINAHVCDAMGVRARLAAVGVLTTAQALELGLVGMAARASGVDVDVRTSLRSAPHDALPVTSTLESSGDCWARALVRIREVDESLRWLKAAIETETLLPSVIPLGAVAPRTLSIALVEGWRGEVMHAIETGDDGNAVHYRVQDPSLRNWMGLALSMRGNDISDFPICNKSFDLSYCGNDL